jgi:hypothetical protein
LSDDEIPRRLVALNAERAEAERRGIIRWLRPEFQNPPAPPKPSRAPDVHRTAKRFISRV